MTIAALSTKRPIYRDRAETQLGLRQQHRVRLNQLGLEARNLQHCAERVADMTDEVLARGGGALQIQAQMNFIVGALMRLTKDWAVVESLQTLHRSTATSGK